MKLSFFKKNLLILAIIGTAVLGFYYLDIESKKQPIPPQLTSQIRIDFAEGATEEEINETIRSIGGRTIESVYTLPTNSRAVELSLSNPTSVIEELKARKNPRVEDVSWLLPPPVAF